MNQIKLYSKWQIKAPVEDVFKLITDFENWPRYFPKVAYSINVIQHEGNNLEIDAVVKSFGRKFPVKMKTQILPGKGFISDNESPKFETSGHEELFLKQNSEGTIIEYNYQVFLHNFWLKLVAKPLIKWFSMKYWEKAVIDEIRKKLEK